MTLSFFPMKSFRKDACRYILAQISLCNFTKLEDIIWLRCYHYNITRFILVIKGLMLNLAHSQFDRFIFILVTFHSSSLD